MARSMIQRRHEADRQRNEAFDTSLRRVSQRDRPAPDFERALHQAKDGFGDRTVRACIAWRPKLKTRDPKRLRLAAARHLFALYPVPAHLELVWLEGEGLGAAEVELRKRWYITVAGGGSLYKAEARPWLSRKEVHGFLNPPGELSFEEAFWVAIARTYTDDLGLALKVGRSKIAGKGREDQDFWRQVVQFFVANPTGREAMDDLVDYLDAAYRRDYGFTLKGRTLASLTRAMVEWHRQLDAINRIEAARQRAEAARARANGETFRPAEDGGRWRGSVLPDWSWKPSSKEAANRGEEFVMTQLNSATDLVTESSVMRHCVSMYASKCIAGYASIWSLRRRAHGRTDRLLTIEVDTSNRAVQVRGFANRLASPDEVKVLERWAKARGVSLP